MESRGVWCRTALSSVQAVDLGALQGADAHSVNQASTKATCYQQVSAGAVMAMLRHARQGRGQAIPCGPSANWACPRSAPWCSGPGGPDRVLSVRQRRQGRPGEPGAAHMARQPRLPASRRSGLAGPACGDSPGRGAREQSRHDQNRYFILATTRRREPAPGPRPEASALSLS